MNRQSWMESLAKHAEAYAAAADAWEEEEGNGSPEERRRMKVLLRARGDLLMNARNAPKK